MIHTIRPLIFSIGSINISTFDIIVLTSSNPIAICNGIPSVKLLIKYFACFI